MILPVIVVLRADKAVIDRKRSFPGFDRVLVGHAFDFRRQFGIVDRGRPLIVGGCATAAVRSCRLGQRNNRAERQMRRVLFQFSVSRFRAIEPQRDAVPDPGVQVGSGPAVQHDLVVRQQNRLARLVEQRPEGQPRFDAGDQRVGDVLGVFPIRSRDRIHDIRGNGLNVALLQCFLKRLGSRRFQQHSVRGGMEIVEHHFVRFASGSPKRPPHALDLNTVILQPRLKHGRGFRRCGRIDGRRIDTATDQQGVDASFLFQGVLDRFQRHKRVAWSRLTGRQAEASQAAVGYDRHDLQSDDRANKVLLLAQRTVSRYFARFGQTQQQPIADLNSQVLGQRGIQDDLVGTGIRIGASGRIAQVPEIVVGTDQENAGGPRRRIFVLCLDRRPREQHRRNRCGEAALEIGIGGQFFGQRLPEEAAGNQHVVDLPQSVQGQRAKTTADRIADDQRARQHRRSRRHAHRHRRIHPAVVEKTAKNQSPPSHVRSSHRKTRSVILAAYGPAGNGEGQAPLRNADCLNFSQGHSQMIQTITPFARLGGCITIWPVLRLFQRIWRGATGRTAETSAAEP